jgi:hypothetical protein
MRASLARASPFKSLVKSGKMPGTIHPREDEDRSFEDDVVAPPKLTDESDEERMWVDEDEETGSDSESLAICVARLALR